MEIVFINICNPTEPAYIETFPNLEIPQLSNIDASQCNVILLHLEGIYNKMFYLCFSSGRNYSNNFKLHNIKLHLDFGKIHCHIKGGNFKIKFKFNNILMIDC